MFPKRKGRNYHHMTPRSRGGKTTQDNMLLIDIERHVYWHKVFRNLTLEEVIRLLVRLREAKRRLKCTTSASCVKGLPTSPTV